MSSWIWHFSFLFNNYNNFLIFTIHFFMWLFKFCDFVKHFVYCLLQYSMAVIEVPWLNEVRWIGVAGYLQRNSSMWLESRSIPYLAAATVRAGWRRCHLALHRHAETKRVLASPAALTPSLPPFSPGLIYRHQASPLCPAQKPWPLERLWPSCPLC